MDYDPKAIERAINTGMLCGYLAGLIRTLGPAETLRTVADSIGSEVFDHPDRDRIRGELRRIADEIARR